MLRAAAMLALVPCIVAACAGSDSVPRGEASALERARAAYQAAASDPLVQLRAWIELEQTERSLMEMERLAKRAVQPGLVARQAAAVEDQARKAVEIAQARDAEAHSATAAGEARHRWLDPAQASVDMASEMRRLQGDLEDVKAQRTDRGWVLILRSDALFDPGGAKLRTGARGPMERLAQFMRDLPEREIAIEGFTDAAGSADENRLLSVRRADAVKQALVDQGIERSRIDTRGYGGAFPVASNDTAAGREENRRVQIVIDPS